jgi:hypothetical protein
VLNVAVTVFSEFIVRSQVGAVPAHAPPQPRNADPSAGFAVRTTEEKGQKAVWHAAPQSMAAGAEVTEPRPSASTVKPYQPGGTDVVTADTSALRSLATAFGLFEWGSVTVSRVK